MKKPAVTIILIIFTSFSFLKASESSARNNALTIAVTASLIGYDVRDSYNTGYLAEGGSTIVNTTLTRGNTYQLIAGGCDDALDVDILVYDENWILISKDETVDRLAVVSFAPKWSGTFYIKIKMYKTKITGAHWVLMYAYK